MQITPTGAFWDTTDERLGRQNFHGHTSITICPAFLTNPRVQKSIPKLRESLVLCYRQHSLVLRMYFPDDAVVRMYPQQTVST